MTGEQLRAWRRKHHLSQLRLAQTLGISKLTVIRWEGGHQAPPDYLGLALERIEQLLRAGTVVRSRGNIP